MARLVVNERPLWGSAGVPLCIRRSCLAVIVRYTADRRFPRACTQLAECMLRRADRYRLREVGIRETDGAPDEKERRPKHKPPGYQAA